MVKKRGCQLSRRPPLQTPPPCQLENFEIPGFNVYHPSELRASFDLRTGTVRSLGWEETAILDYAYAVQNPFKPNGELTAADSRIQDSRKSFRFHILHGSYSVFGYPNNHVSERCTVPIDSDERRSTVWSSDEDDTWLTSLLS
ncbi:hypothetical protein TNCV_1963541 [Trichonephila clavipes]|nr:hypothetical protein TNCV_1963541 [Trichonephila clavipes]